MDNEKKRLIIGLGNPGAPYKGTRHNVGFMIVEVFAQKNGFSFKNAAHVFGELAQGIVDDKKVFVLEPTTFMNESGLAVRRCVDYYKVPLHDLIVVSDDIALPVGAMRMRTKGSCGGHNGLYSVETHLNSEHYARLRIGIGSPPNEWTKDYVLSAFNQGEAAVIEETVVRAVHALELWLMAGIAAAMQATNAQKTEENSGDNKNDQAKKTSL